MVLMATAIKPAMPEAAVNGSIELEVTRVELQAVSVSTQQGGSRMIVVERYTESHDRCFVAIQIVYVNGWKDSGTAFGGANESIMAVVWPIPNACTL